MKMQMDDTKIGLLVFLALALFVGFLFHRSLTAILKKETLVRMSLENASDLGQGTEVQLQGLRVGQVEAVNLEREGVNYRFLALLGLRTDIVLWEGTRAQVVAKPLGGSYVDLLLPPPQERLAVLAPGSILPGSTSASLSTLVDGVDLLVRNLNQGVNELRGHFRQRGLGAVLDHPQVAQTLHSLQDTLRAFGQLARDGQGLVRQGQQAMPPLERSLASLDKSLAGVQKLLDSRSGDLDAIIQNLAATLKEMRALTTGLDTMLQKTGPSGDEAIKALERDLRSTEELLELLKAKPSRVVWGKPSQAEREAAAEKVRAARQAQGAKP